MPASASDADELLVVVNRKMAGAEGIARYYMKQRNIPEDRLLTVSLSLSEVMKREEYDKKLVLPVRNALTRLEEEGQRISVVVLIYGVPLKVEPPALDWSTEDLLGDLKKELKTLKSHAKKLESPAQMTKELKARIDELEGTSKRASVDSELMLVRVKDYPLAGWLENPYFPGFRGRKNLLKKDDVLLVARLDGPDEKTVYRLIDDTIATERAGLSGKAYFDARWPMPREGKKLSGYALYDASLHRAATVVEKRMPVVLDSSQALFAKDAAPDAALYSGWYSLAKYIDSFTWVRGAVAYHIASAECSTLRKFDSQVWCPQMLKHGVAATIGPVYEPYVQGFPLPEIFFAAFTEGYMNLGESYLISLPYISWQMVLVGDPLYRPFKPVQEMPRNHQ